MAACGRQHPKLPHLKCDRPAHLAKADRQHSALDLRNAGRLVEWVELPPSQR